MCVLRWTRCAIAFRPLAMLPLGRPPHCQLVRVCILLCFATGCGRLPDGLFAGSRPSFTSAPDTVAIALSYSSASQVFLLNLSTGSAQAIGNDGNGATDPKFSPALGQILYAVHYGDHGSVMKVSLDGSNRATVTTSSGYVAVPVFVPRLNAVAFAAANAKRSTSTFGESWEDWDIYLAPISGGATRRITHTAFRELQSMDVLGDGVTVVASVRSLGGTMRLLVLNTETGRTTFPGSEGVYSAASVPGSDDEVICVRRVGTNTSPYRYEVFRENLSGERTVQLTDLGVLPVSPSVSPDGRQLIVLGDRRRDRRFQLLDVALQTHTSRVVHVVPAKGSR